MHVSIIPSLVRPNKDSVCTAIGDSILLQEGFDTDVQSLRFRWSMSVMDDRKTKFLVDYLEYPKDR